MGLSQWLFLYRLSSIACPSEPAPTTSSFDLPRQITGKRNHVSKCFSFQSPVSAEWQAQTPPPSPPPAGGRRTPRRSPNEHFLEFPLCVLLSLSESRTTNSEGQMIKRKRRRETPEEILWERLFRPSVMVNCGSYSLVQSWLQRHLQHS